MPKNENYLSNLALSFNRMSEVEKKEYFQKMQTLKNQPEIEFSQEKINRINSMLKKNIISSK